MNKATTFVLAVVAFGFAQLTHGQIFKTGNEKPNSEFVPHSAVAGMALFPAKLSAKPEFKAFPHEVVTAWGMKELGFDPMLISEVTLILKGMDQFPPNEPPGWAAVMHFDKMQGLAGRMIDELEEKTIGGKTVYSGAPYQPSFMVFDESTIIVGEETWFEDLITAVGQKGDLTKMFNDPGVRGQMMAFADFKSMRPMFRDMLAEFDNYELPSQVADFRQIPDLIDSIELGLDVDGKVEAQLLIHGDGADNAQRVSDIVVEGMQFAKVTLLAQMAQELDLADPVQAATLAYARRVAEKYETKMTPKLDGADLSVTLHEEIIAIPFLLGMVGTTTRGMAFERKMTPELQLRIATLAALNYESAYNKFPSTTINDDSGRPLFSGQVAILPFMEQNSLYQNLRMDEPWDSEHNAQYTSMAIPSFGITSNGDANLRFPVFPGSLWDDGGGKTFGDIQDGSSNTIFAIIAPDDSGASWADPTPWKISESNPMRDVFGDRDEVHVGMADGSSRVLKRSEMTNEKLKAMLTIGGGEVIPRD